MAYKFLMNTLTSGRKYLHLSHADMLLEEVVVKKNPDEVVTKTTVLSAHTLLGENVHDIPDVDIDTGEFNYLLIDVINHDVNGLKCYKRIIRGSRLCKYHTDVLHMARKELQQYNLDGCARGGGKMIRNSQKRILHIFGSSQKYGGADHSSTAEMLRYSFPFYKITFEE